MKIAIFISSLRFGGAEKQAIIDCQLLAKENKVYLIAFREGELRHQIPDSVEFIRLKKRDYFSTAYHLARLLKRLRIEVVHAHLFAPMVISSMASLLCQAKVVWNFHSHAYQDADKGRLAHSLASKVPRVKRILFPANELKEYYTGERYTFPPAKQMIFFNSGQYLERQPFQHIPREVVTVGYVGRIIPLKRVHLLLKLAESLKEKDVRNVHISIVGDGNSMPELKAAAKQKGVAEMVTFHGFQSNTRQHYERFDLFALPSEEEVLSLSLIDAQLSGLPAVAFDVGGNKDIIEHGRSGFIVQQEQEFIERLQELLLDEVLRIRMGQRAIEQSTDKFSQQARADNLQNLYKTVLHS